MEHASSTVGSIELKALRVQEKNSESAQEVERRLRDQAVWTARPCWESA